jgi:hypothetical protein
MSFFFLQLLIEIMSSLNYQKFITISLRLSKIKNKITLQIFNKIQIFL